MRNTLQSFRNTLYGLIAVGCVFAGALATHAEGMAEGIAFATSVKGSIQMTDAEGQHAQPNLHDTLILNESTIETGQNAHIFFALSNGIGIGIGQNSEVVFETYVQQPFPARKNASPMSPLYRFFRYVSLRAV